MPIKIEKNRLKTYRSIKEMVDKLVLLDEITNGNNSYEYFAKKVFEIFNKLEINKEHNFKSFIADLKDGDISVEICSEEYETLINVQLVYNFIYIYNEKSSNKITWDVFGLGIQSIIMAYIKNNV